MMATAYVVDTNVKGTSMQSSLVVGSQTTPATTRSVATPTARRISRPTTTAVTPQNRLPVLLEFTETSLRCGIVGDTSPKDILPLQTSTSSCFQSEPSIRDPSGVWYRYLAPILKCAYQRLGLGVKDRKAIVLFRGYDQTSLPRNIEQALLSILITDIGVPAVNLQFSSLSMAPYCFPWVRDMLVVSVSLTDAECLVHSSGENLPFTYQNVPLVGENHENSFDTTFLDINNHNSVIVAILKALEACPRTIRKTVVSNIVFAGTGLIKQPQVPLLMVKRLKALLATAAAPSPAEKPGKASEREGDVVPGDSQVASITVSLPISWKVLAGLEPSVGLITSGIRPHMLSWMGATQWAMHWHGQDPLLHKWKWFTSAPLKI